MEEEFNKIGITLKDSNGQMKSTYDILGEMATAYEGPNDNNVWTYTPLFVSSQLTISATEVVEIQAEELASNQYAFYYTDNEGKPRVIYVPTTLGAYSALKYSMDAYTNAGAGMQSLESIDVQTSLQVSCKPGVEFVSQSRYAGRNKWTKCGLVCSRG